MQTKAYNCRYFKYYDRCPNYDNEAISNLRNGVPDVKQSELAVKANEICCSCQAFIARGMVLNKEEWF